MYNAILALFLTLFLSLFFYVMKKSGKNGRRRKDVEFEEIMGNLNSRKRQERKDERENGINREM